jgi:hypothetical protein
MRRGASIAHPAGDHQLYFRNWIRLLLRERVLRRQYEEGLRQYVGRPRRRHGMLLHRLQQFIAFAGL